jgi:hypothetical protein
MWRKMALASKNWAERMRTLNRLKVPTNSEPFWIPSGSSQERLGRVLRAFMS